MNLFARLLVYVAMFTILSGIAVVSYWLAWPYQVVGPFPPFVEVLNPGKTIVAGHHLIYQGNTQHLTTGVNVTTNRELVDGVVVNYPQTGYVTDGKYFNGINSTTIIPSYTPPGEYYLKITATFQVNPLRSIIIERRTETFTVIAPEDTP